MKLRKLLKPTAFSLLAFFLISCATYPYETRNAQDAFFMGDYEKAAQLLEPKSKEEGKDQLLYLFDRGLALQLSGNYKDSSKDLLAADKMSEVKDYVSLSEEAASVVINDTLKQYKGEDFEKVLINAFLAINYTMAGEFEDALVECRRLNNKLQRYKAEAKKDYEQNPFARYLSALIWEATGKYESAYIDYKFVHGLTPEYPPLKTDLIRLAKRLDRDEDLKKWKAQYGDVDVPSRKEEARSGEVVLIYQQGKGAQKRPNPSFAQLPKFYPRFTNTVRARIQVDSDAEKKADSEKIYSVSDVAIKTLDDAYAGLIAKKAAGFVAKEVLADQVRQKNEVLGAIAWIGLHATDQADLRYWVTLPESLQFARLRLQPGAYKIKVIGLDDKGGASGEEKLVDVTVAAGKKAFINWRSLR